jgi:hypothetical protein
VHSCVGQIQSVGRCTAAEIVNHRAHHQLFRLLRLQAVLARRLVVGEVYDIMGRVQTLLVRAHAAAVRQVASAVRPLRIRLLVIPWVPASSVQCHRLLHIC